MRLFLFGELSLFYVATVRKIFIASLFFLPLCLTAQTVDNLENIVSLVPKVSGGLPIIHVLDVQIDGDKLYSSGYGGITLFDISDIDQPKQMSNYNPFTGPTGAFYHRMVQKNGIVYATRRVGGLDILDFTDADNPKPLLTYQLNDSTAYENVILSGDTLFASCYKSGIEVINVADPAAPQHITFIPSANALSAAKSGRYLFIADVLDGLVIYDVHDVMNPKLISKTETSGAPQYITVNDNLAFLSVGAAGVDIYNVSQPKAPVLLSNYPGLSFCPQAVVKDNLLYMAEWDVVEVVDVSDPAAPVRLAKEDTKSQSMGINAAKGLVFVADWGAINIYRFSRQSTPDLYAHRKFLSYGAFSSGVEEQQKLTITNTGQAPLVATDVNTDAPTLAATPTNFTLQPGKSLELTVVFKPGSEEKYSSNIIIASNDPDQPQIKIPVYAGYADFGPGDPAPDFSLMEAQSNKKVSLSDFRGKLVFLSAFASW